MTDQAIITLIRAGQSDKALDALYRFFPVVRKMIRNNGGNRQDAEDIFQEALIILCKKIRETDFILTAQLSTYLFSVSRYLWKDDAQKRRLFIAGTPELPEEESDIQAAVVKERDARLAEKVLQELGDRCRELLLLYYTGRMKLKDIAVKMGYSSENTAKNQKYKCLEGARNRLREMQEADKISTH
jgi:RNA polymerase sigma factor (sigma-70 family)